MTDAIFYLFILLLAAVFVWLSVYLSGKLSEYASSKFQAPMKDRIVVGEDGFVFFKDGDAVEKIQLDDIVRLEVYKEDHITVDLICCDIFLGAGDSARYRTVHEELEGFKDLMKSFETLPGFDDKWLAAIVKPAFEENRTVVFDRVSGKDFRPVW